MYTRNELVKIARRYGYSIRRINGEDRLINDQLNAAMYLPRTREEIAYFLTHFVMDQDSDGENPAIFG